jgi:hypothetical protein
VLSAAARRSVPAVAFPICAALLCAAVLAMHVVRLPEPLGVDQGAFACFARWVPRGALPYRDLFDVRPPLFLYWWAASSLVPAGDVARAAWWWEGLWLAATLGAAFAFGRELGGRWVGLVAAALLFVGIGSPAWSDHGDPFATRAMPEEALALPMIASAWLARRAADRERLAFGAGALAGVCGLFAVPSIAIVLAWSVAWLTTQPGRDAARRVGWMIAGAAVPWAIAFAWFAAHRATSSFVDAVFVQGRYAAAFTALPWSVVIQRFATSMLAVAPLHVVAGAMGVVRLARRTGTPAREVHGAAAWIIATVAAVIAERKLAGHASMMVLPALSIVGAVGVVGAARAVADAGTRFLALAALAGLALFAGRESLAWWRAYAPDVAVTAGRVSRDEYLRSLSDGAFSPADEEQVARSVRDQTSPADGILVWAQSPGVYALADRHPVTRYTLDKILLTDAPLSRAWPGLDVRRQDFIDRMRGDPPAIVLVGQNDANALEPQDSYASVGRFRALRAFLQQGYESAPAIGGFLVFRRVTRGS